jgi:curli biogenesis system outer membrane secretion channel CsgG
MAVSQFEAQNVSGGDAAVIADIFRTEVIKGGTFDVVEKANMDKILGEQAFQQTGCTTSDCAVKLGKILNVKYLVVGSFGKLMDAYVLSFRVIEVETAKAIYSDDAQGLVTQREVTAAIKELVRKLTVAVTTQGR